MTDVTILVVESGEKSVRGVLIIKEAVAYLPGFVAAVGGTVLTIPGMHWEYQSLK